MRRGVALAALAGGALSAATVVVSNQPADASSLDPVDAGAVLAADVTLVDPLIEVPSPLGVPAVLVAPAPAPAASPTPPPQVADAPALAGLADAVGGREQQRSADAEERSGEEDDDRAAETDRPAPAASDADPEQDRPSTAAATDCSVDTSGLGRVKPHVRAAAEFLACRYGEPTMAGIAGRGGPSDHPRGLALDFMVGRTTGDALAACALENKKVLGVNYVIWRQRINHGSGWKTMPDRGGATANHFDHVHVSFRDSGGGASRSSC